MLKLRFKNNKYNAVWLVEPKVTIGRLSSNDLVVDDPEVADVHLEILVDHERLTLKNLVADRPVKLNNESVTRLCTLKAKDIITIGRVVLEVIDPKREPKAEAGEPQESAAGTQAKTGWALKSNHPALANRVFPLHETTVIGRSSDCDISLSAAHLSRRHARLQVMDGLLYVKDLGSANGTFLNGKQIVEARVKRGDELRLDTLSFGIIGPADDLAKTTVRRRPPQATAGTAETRPAPRSSTPGLNPAAHATKKTVETNKSEKFSRASETPTHYGSYSMGILVVLVIIVVAALYLKG